VSNDVSFLVTNQNRAERIASVLAKFPRSIDAVSLPSSGKIDLSVALENPSLTNEQVAVLLVVVEDVIQNVGNVVTWRDELEAEQKIFVTEAPSVDSAVLMTSFSQKSHINELGLSDAEVKKCLAAEVMQPVLQQCYALSTEAAQFVQKAKKIVFVNSSR
jgi:hypothetical protein